MTDTSMAGRFAENDFRIGRVFNRSFSLLSKHWLLFPIITAIAYVPTLFVPGAEQLVIGAQTGVVPVGTIVRIFVAVLVMFVLIFLTQAAIVHAAFQSMRGQRIDLGESAKVGLRRFFPIVGIMIIWMLALIGVAIVVFAGGGALAYALGAPLLTFVFALAFFVAMGFLVTMWFAALQACVVERAGVFGSFRRSTQLTKGNRWRILGLLLVILVIGMFVGILVGVIAGALSLLMGAIVATVITFVWQAIWGAYYAITGVVAYHDLRVAKEGIDIEQIAAVFD
jgi:hypothetical protein